MIAKTELIKSSKPALRKLKTIWKIIFITLLVLAFAAHLCVIIVTKKYLITSGIIFIISFFVLFYYFILLMRKVFGFNIKVDNFRLTIVSISVCLIIVESIFILSGYNSTYLEKRYKFYYESEYIPKNKNHLWVWDHDHDLKTNEYFYHRAINSLGLSDIEHPISKKDNEYRIIGLGDSFTEGDGTDQDSTWLKFLSHDLEKYSFKKTPVFMNAGVCGSDPFFEYMLLKEKLLKYKPDLLIVAINETDINDIIIRGGVERFLPDGTVKYNDPPWFEPIYASLHISRLIFINDTKFNDQLISCKKVDVEKAMTKIFQCVLLFDQLSKEKHFKLLLVTHPLSKEIAVNKLKLADVADKIKKETKIYFLDMLEYISTKEGIGQKNVSEYFWKFDGHHNSKGYAAFARGIEWKLKEMGIIDSLKSE